MGADVGRGSLVDGEMGEGPTAHWATPVKLAQCAVTVLGI